MTRRQSQPGRGDLQHRQPGQPGHRPGREIFSTGEQTPAGTPAGRSAGTRPGQHARTPGIDLHQDSQGNQPGRKYQSGTKPGGARLTGDTRTGARDLPGQARTAAAAHYRRRSLLEILDSGREKNRKKRKRVIAILIFPKYSPPYPGRRRQG